jgi:hypothetical protein
VDLGGYIDHVILIRHAQAGGIEAAHGTIVTQKGRWNNGASYVVLSSLQGLGVLSVKRNKPAENTQKRQKYGPGLPASGGSGTTMLAWLWSEGGPERFAP